jgi:hypothetical protein
VWAFRLRSETCDSDATETTPAQLCRLRVKNRRLLRSRQKGTGDTFVAVLDATPRRETALHGLGVHRTRRRLSLSVSRMVHWAPISMSHEASNVVLPGRHNSS